MTLGSNILLYKFLLIPDHRKHYKIIPVKKGKKSGRNAVCYCGSGKKYKKCCLNDNTKK